jgi:hypothetical protein
MSGPSPGISCLVALYSGEEPSFANRSLIQAHGARRHLANAELRFATVAMPSNLNSGFTSPLTSQTIHQRSHHHGCAGFFATFDCGLQTATS